jgi:BirA family biotin operon repressor/biotin-[acetyl-CoA-carboxylase] ligase
MPEPEHPYAKVAAELAGSAFPQVRYVAETSSTNDDASELLGNESAGGLTIVAEYQSSGAGRKGRSWLAAPGTALLFTSIVPREIPARELWVVPFWTALAVRRALASLGVDTTMHWPNDLLLGENKLAGILCVSRSAGERAWAACGVGINVERSPDVPAIDPPAAFCDDRCAIERAELLRAILLEFDATLESLENPQRVARLWETQAGLPGRRYRLHVDGAAAPFEATALSLATGGGLVVAREDGTRETISLADARALRSNHQENADAT